MCLVFFAISHVFFCTCENVCSKKGNFACVAAHCRDCFRTSAAFFEAGRKSGTECFAAHGINRNGESV